MKRDKMRFLSLGVLWSMFFITASSAATVQPPSSKAPVIKGSKPSSSSSITVKPLPDIVIGDELTPITVIMYFSPTCHHCAEYEKTILPEVIKDLVSTGKVRFIIRLLPFHKLDYTVAKLIWSRGFENVLQLTQLFLSHQEEWLDPVLEDPKKREQLLQKALEETARLLGIPFDVLRKRLKTQDNIEDAFVFLFALKQGFTLEELDNASQEDLELENGLTAAHIQAGQDLGTTLYAPAFVVNGKVVKDWPKPETLSKLLNKIEIK